MAIRTEPGLDPVLTDLVRKAGPLIERILGDAADRVEVVWEPGGVDADGEPTARVRFTDAGVSKARTFNAWDFGDEDSLAWDLRQLWGEVLVDRIRIQRQRVLESLAESGEG